MFKKDLDWNYPNFHDWRGKFFIESYLESLYIFTPHFHQAKLMGIIDLSEEVLTNIKVYEDNDKGKGYLISSLKELKNVFDSDIVSQILFKDIKEIFVNCEKNFSQEKFPKSLILQLSILCKRISSERKNYFNLLVKMLSDNVIGKLEDITQKGRLTITINSLTRNFITFLLNEGYSATFLFNRINLFFNEKRTKNDFLKDFIFFLNSLNCKESIFYIYFAINTNKKSIISSYTPFTDVKIFESITDEKFPTPSRVFTNVKIDFYFRYKINALDHISASWKASSLIESETNYIEALSFGTYVNIKKDCYVIFKMKGNSQQKRVRMNALNNLLSYDYKSNMLVDYLNLGSCLKLDDKSIKLLESSFKNLRLAQKTSQVDQKLISTWIALETLSYSSDEQQSIISAIVNYIPKAYALNSIIGRVYYVLFLLSENKINIPHNIKEKFNLSEEKFSKDMSQNIFFNILADENYYKDICALLTGEDLLIFRVCSLNKLISKSSEMRKRINATQIDIERHIYRIYHYRNKIIHNGHSSNLSYYIINHLTDYVYSHLENILEVLSKKKHFDKISLDEVLLSSHLVVENTYKDIQTSEINLDKLKQNVII